MEKNKREKRRYVRELLIMAIFLAIIGITVSYAVVNVTLKVSGVSSAKIANWLVRFESTQIVDKKGTAEIVYEPRIHGLNIYYEVQLNNPGDSVTLKALVKNKGNMNAKLESYDLFGIPSQYKNHISYKVTGENGADLKPGTLLKGYKLHNELERYMAVYITVTYENPIYDSGYDYRNFNLGLSLNFVQDCEKCYFD